MALRSLLSLGWAQTVSAGCTGWDSCGGAPSEVRLVMSQSIACYEEGNPVCKPDRPEFSGLQPDPGCIPNGPCSSGGEGYYMASMFRHAIQLVNENPDLLPNTQITYEILDTQGSPTLGSLNVIKAVKDEGAYGLIGGYHSSISVAANSIMNHYQIPSISACSTSPALSDKDKFPYFFRTVSPDSYMANALIKIIKSMGWQKVATLNTQDDFASRAIDAFIKAGLAQGLEIVTSAEFPFGSSNADAAVAIKQLQKYQVKVVVVFATFEDAWRAWSEADRLGMKGAQGVQWLGPAGDLRYPGFDKVDDRFEVTQGFLGLSMAQASGPEYDAVLAKWQALPACSYLGKDYHELSIRESEGNCFSGAGPGSDMSMSTAGYGPYVYDAVFSYAETLHALIESKTAMCHTLDTNPCVTQDGSIDLLVDNSIVNGKTCPERNPCTSSFVEKLKKVADLKKEGLTGPLAFNEWQDRPVNYELVNWQKKGSVSLGEYKWALDKFSPTLVTMNAEKLIVFNDGTTNIPKDHFEEPEPEKNGIYLVLPVGLVIAGFALFCIFRKKSVAIDALRVLVAKSAQLVFALLMELIDITTDSFVLVVLMNSDQAKEKFFLPYAFFYGTGVCTFSINWCINLQYLGRVISFKEPDAKDLEMKYKAAVESCSKTAAMLTDLPPFEIPLELSDDQKKRNFLRAHRDRKLAQSAVNKTLGTIMVLCFEDIPMMVITTQLMTFVPEVDPLAECVANENAGAFGGPVVVASLVISCLMMGIKFAAASAVAKRWDENKVAIGKEYIALAIAEGEVVAGAGWQKKMSKKLSKKGDSSVAPFSAP